MKKKRYHPLKWIIWSLAVSFYFYEYFIRVFPSVIADELVSYFHINALSLGALSAFYLYAYAPMQLPAGALMDRYGARKLLTIASFVCGLATLLFSQTHSIWIADFSRIIMGVGSAFGFIGMIYITSHWFPAKNLALLVAIGNSLGMLGAVGGLSLLGYVVQVINWKPTLNILGIAGIILAIIIFLVVKNDPKETKEKTEKTRVPLKEKSITLLKNTQNWINSFNEIMYYAPVAAFAGFWATPFFQDAHGLTLAQGAFCASMTFIGVIIGGPIIGHFSDKVKSRKIFLLSTPPLAVILFIPLIYFPPLSFTVIASLMLLIGVSISSNLLNYSLAIELNPEKSKGLSLAFLNCMCFIGGGATQTIVGYLINSHGNVQSGTTTYPIESYQLALSIFPILLIIGIILAFFLKEKKHKSHITYQ